MIKNLSGFTVAGVFAAVGASLCCLTPLVAVIVGAGSVGSSFSWIEPFRPYLIGLTIVVLGFAWFQKLRPRSEIECCDVESSTKDRFRKSKSFLALITLFAAVSIAFPYYSEYLYPTVGTSSIAPSSNAKGNTGIEASSKNQTTVFLIEGMTCESCEESIKHAVTSQIAGAMVVNADYHTGSAAIAFDSTRVTRDHIAEVIEQGTGYEVKSYRDQLQ